MWMMAANNNGSTSSGEMQRASIDGLDVETNVSGLSGAHHDFAATPDNGLAASPVRFPGGLTRLQPGITESRSVNSEMRIRRSATPPPKQRIGSFVAA
jgi:hypothetical protein